MRTFVLERHEDVSGVSGVGTVAEGVQFTDGRCVMRWLSKSPTTTHYDSVHDIAAIHGHDGRTQVVFI